VWNRAAILKCLKIEIQRARRQKSPLTVILADVDKFKSVNDTYGHQIGDRVLHNVAQTMAKNLRIYDSVGRYGGEEFLIVAPGCDHSTALSLSGRLHSQIRNHSMSEDGAPVMVTCSFGVVTTTKEVEVDSDKLIRLADEALYRAKAKGRDRVEMSS
jgi:diguanylate cyclase (GGDEF)-like protein